MGSYWLVTEFRGDFLVIRTLPLRVRAWLAPRLTAFGYRSHSAVLPCAFALVPGECYRQEYVGDDRFVSRVSSLDSWYF